MFDIGVNLDHPSYLSELSDFRERYQTAGVEGIICIASTVQEARALREHCAPYDDMFYTIGCHPHHASSWQDSDLSTIETMFQKDSKAIALGEMGLDFNRNYSTPEEQRYAFSAQLELAASLDKPLYLHERDAFESLVQPLKHASHNHRGVIHCFTGNQAQMENYLELGLYVGITGWLLDERRNQELKEAVRALPLERLLLETDAPYLLPRNIRPRPKRNHPMYLPYIAQAVADIKNIPVEQVVNQSKSNTQALFFV